METTPLRASLRTKTGSRVAKHLRAAGSVPGVLYGKGHTPVPLAVDRRELMAAVGHHRAEGTLVTLTVDGADLGETLAMIKEIQVNPLTHQPLAVDLQRVSLTERIHVHVPVEFVGHPVGAEMGGILEHVIRDVEILALPTQVPEALQVDVSGMNIGDSLRVRDIIPPEGVEILTDPDETVAHVSPPAKIEAPVAAVAEAATEEAAAAEEEGVEGE